MPAYVCVVDFPPNLLHYVRIVSRLNSYVHYVIIVCPPHHPVYLVMPSEEACNLVGIHGSLPQIMPIVCSAVILSRVRGVLDFLRRAPLAATWTLRASSRVRGFAGGGQHAPTFRLQGWQVASRSRCAVLCSIRAPLGTARSRADVLNKYGGIGFHCQGRRCAAQPPPHVEACTLSRSQVPQRHPPRSNFHALCRPDRTRAAREGKTRVRASARGMPEGRGPDRHRRHDDPVVEFREGGDAACAICPSRRRDSRARAVCCAACCTWPRACRVRPASADCPQPPGRATSSAQETAHRTFNSASRAITMRPRASNRRQGRATAARATPMGTPRRHARGEQLLAQPIRGTCALGSGVCSSGTWKACSRREHGQLLTPHAAVRCWVPRLHVHSA